MGYGNKRMVRAIQTMILPFAIIAAMASMSSCKDHEDDFREGFPLLELEFDGAINVETLKHQIDSLTSAVDSLIYLNSTSPSYLVIVPAERTTFHTTYIGGCASEAKFHENNFRDIRDLETGEKIDWIAIWPENEKNSKLKITIKRNDSGTERRAKLGFFGGAFKNGVQQTIIGDVIIFQAPKTEE